MRCDKAPRQNWIFKKPKKIGATDSATGVLPRRNGNFSVSLRAFFGVRPVLSRVDESDSVHRHAHTRMPVTGVTFVHAGQNWMDSKKRAQRFQKQFTKKPKKFKKFGGGGKRI